MVLNKFHLSAVYFRILAPQAVGHTSGVKIERIPDLYTIVIHRGLTFFILALIVMHRRVICVRVYQAL
jgi:hypothetical protein